MSTSFKAYPFGLLEENTYILEDNTGTCKAVVDPGCYTEAIKEHIGDASNLKYIILTHSHGDHIMALPEYRKAYPDAKLVLSADEAPLLADSSINGSADMGKGISDTGEILVNDNDFIEFGESSIRCISTPGHTIGGMCYLVDGRLFCGDTLFYMSVGATHFATGDWPALQKSIHDKLYALPDNTEVLPGHGPMTLIGFEKKNNPYVQILP